MECAMVRDDTPMAQPSSEPSFWHGASSLAWPDSTEGGLRLGGERQGGGRKEGWERNGGGGSLLLLWALHPDLEGKASQAYVFFGQAAHRE